MQWFPPPPSMQAPCRIEQTLIQLASLCLSIWHSFVHHSRCVFIVRCESLRTMLCLAKISLTKSMVGLHKKLTVIQLSKNSLFLWNPDVHISPYFDSPEPMESCPHTSNSKPLRFILVLYPSLMPWPCKQCLLLGLTSEMLYALSRVFYMYCPSQLNVFNVTLLGEECKL